jgi:hypothetical protein
MISYKNPSPFKGEDKRVTLIHTTLYLARGVRVNFPLPLTPSLGGSENYEESYC